jgi:hypothetical protein
MFTFKLLSQNGTTITPDRFKVQYQSYGEINPLTLSDVCWVHIPGKHSEVVTILSTGRDVPLVKPALSAITLHLRHDRYGHPRTQSGLHLFEYANTIQRNGTNLGVMSYPFFRQMGHKLRIKSWPTQLSNWAQLDKRNDEFRLSSIHAAYRMDTHDTVDDLINGLGVRVRVAHVRQYLAKILKQWLEEDDKIAWNHHQTIVEQAKRFTPTKNLARIGHNSVQISA